MVERLAATVNMGSTQLNRPGFDGGSGYLVSTSSPVPVS
jgi:hypothetical protein